MLSRRIVFLVGGVIGLALADGRARTFLRSNHLIVSTVVPKTGERSTIEIINYFLLRGLVQLRSFNVALTEMLLVSEVRRHIWTLLLLLVHLLFCLDRTCFADAWVWLIFHTVVNLMTFLVMRVGLRVNNGILFGRSSRYLRRNVVDKMIVSLADISSQVVIHSEIGIIIFYVQIFIAYTLSGTMADILSVATAHHDVVVWIFAGQIILIKFNVLVTIESYLSVIISIEVHRVVAIFVSEAVWTKRMM